MSDPLYIAIEIQRVQKRVENAERSRDKAQEALDAAEDELALARHRMSDLLALQAEMAP